VALAAATAADSALAEIKGIHDDIRFALRLFGAIGAVLLFCVTFLAYGSTVLHNLGVIR
jgi:hypothetical protein